SESLTDPFATTDTETTVTVTDASHGGVTGGAVVFSGASAVGGITLDGEYVMTVIDGDTYTVESADPATSTTTGGGAVAADYQILPGRADAVAGGGYGGGLYGTGIYGAPRPD